MARNYQQRCAERLDRLRYRAAFLTSRIEMRVDSESTHDKMERSAVLWAIEEIDRWETVAAILLDVEADDSEKVSRIAAILRSRLHPSDADRERTPGLRRQREQVGA